MGEGDVLASGIDSGEILFYSLSTMREVGRIVGAHGRPCVSAMLCPRDATLLLSASGSRFFPDYDVESDDDYFVVNPETAPSRELGASSVKRRKVGDPSTQHRLDNAIRIWKLDWALAAADKA